MINNFKLTLMKVIAVILITTLGLELKIISLKNQKELEIQNKIQANKEQNKHSHENKMSDLLELENDFNISKLENNKLDSWNGYINFSGPLEEGIKKLEYLVKKDFTIENYNVEYKDGYGIFSLKVRAGD